MSSRAGHIYSNDTPYVSPNRESRQKYYRKLKAEMLAAYGEACAECGAVDRLELHHTKGDGHKHVHAPVGSGAAYWRALRKLGWPQDLGLQILCKPCHIAADIRRRKGEAERNPKPPDRPLRQP